MFVALGVACFLLAVVGAKWAMREEAAAEKDST
jgi:hypothetical protein